MKRETGVQGFGQDTHHKYWRLNPALLSVNPGIVIPQSPEILESLTLNVTRLRDGIVFDFRAPVPSTVRLLLLIEVCEINKCSPNYKLHETRLSRMHSTQQMLNKYLLGE